MRKKIPLRYTDGAQVACHKSHNAENNFFITMILGKMSK